jgi:uncharacterized protein YdiU (UPF0061 family)
VVDIGFHFDNSYTRLPQTLFTRQPPVPVSKPELILFNQALAKAMGLDFSVINHAAQAELLSGNQLPQGADPIAQAYAGYQFGHFTMLGDGRAIVLGEHLTPSYQRLDIQYKGSGRTPYSRRGDGRAALSPMLREYIISEAMHSLGVPTTRSLAITTTGETVWRETALPGAILTRVASSHLRIGTFEYAASQQNYSLLQTLLEYTIDRHYPELKEVNNKAFALLKAVMTRQTDLIVNWMRIGFIHGVMNTDNITLSGETIDYGPCAFIDAYNPHTVFSAIDRSGRYAYGNQPVILQWNLARFAETLLPLIDDNIEHAAALAEETLNAFSKFYEEKWLDMMRGKLGLFAAQANDQILIEQLLNWMYKNNADYTNTFRDLMSETIPTQEIYHSAEFQAWHQLWQARLALNPKPLSEAFKLMRTNNPVIIPRNHIVEQALQAASNEQDLKPLHALLAVLTQPYTRPKNKYYLEPSLEAYQTFCGT